jgi:hypothetical protein
MITKAVLDLIPSFETVASDYAEPARIVADKLNDGG